MSELLEPVRTALDTLGWRYHEVDDDGERLILFAVSGSNAGFQCYAKARSAHGQCLVYAVFAHVVPEDRRARMAEVLCRANYGTVVGNFELDFDDGEVRYKASVDVADSQLTPLMARAMITITVAMMNRYWPALDKAISSEESPRALVAEVEG